MMSMRIKEAGKNPIFPFFALPVIRLKISSYIFKGTGTDDDEKSEKTQQGNDNNKVVSFLLKIQQESKKICSQIFSLIEQIFLPFVLRWIKFYIIFTRKEIIENFVIPQEVFHSSAEGFKNLKCNFVLFFHKIILKNI